MAQRAAVEGVRQQLEKSAKVGFIEFLGRSELPDQGTEMRARFSHTRL